MHQLCFAATEENETMEFHVSNICTTGYSDTDQNSLACIVTITTRTKDPSGASSEGAERGLWDKYILRDKDTVGAWYSVCNLVAKSSQVNLRSRHPPRQLVQRTIRYQLLLA
jgi:hypothetical protein